MKSRVSTLDNNDEAFLNLLSSQRALLNRLNMESAAQRNQQAPANLSLKDGQIRGVDSLNFINKPISTVERRNSLEMVFSRRLSFGIGSDSMIVPGTMYNDWDDAFVPKDFRVAPDLDPFMTTSRQHAPATRRDSTVDFFGSSTAFDDPLASRRLSLVSNLSKPIDIDERLERDLSVTIEKKQEPVVPLKPRVKVDPKANLKALRRKFEAFTKAMEKSTKSQQGIHDWDKKMGLKRSHSKTMRMSMRSRKKLKAMFKKELNALTSAR